MRVLGILSMALLALPSPALAKSEKNLDYPFASVWSTAVRLIRADKGWAIRDKDKETGYILFVYPGSGSVKECPASLEIVPFVEGKVRRIRVQLSIAHQPSYVEVHFLDALEQKLRDEQGEARPTPDRPKREKEKEKEKEKDKDGARPPSP